MSIIRVQMITNCGIVTADTFVLFNVFCMTGAKAFNHSRLTSIDQKVFYLLYNIFNSMTTIPPYTGKKSVWKIDNYHALTT